MHSGAAGLLPAEPEAESESPQSCCFHSSFPSKPPVEIKDFARGREMS